MSDATGDTVAWHSIESEEALRLLRTDAATGLGDGEAKRRLHRHGPNELRAAKRSSALRILAQQFSNVLILILLGAVLLSAFLGQGLEAVAIAVIVLFAVLLGFIQEYRAEKALEALKKMTAPTATVIRGGVEKEIPARDLVDGDIVVLATGDRIPADARVLRSLSLGIDEAALTGESVPVEKQSEALAVEAVGVADRRNIVFAGTAVTRGRGLAAVVATGMRTEFGKIARLLEDVESRQTPLQKNLDRVGRRLAQAAACIVILIGILGYWRGEALLEVVISAIALAVAVVPEALPAVVTISLAIGVQRMSKRHALVRRLAAVETLGCTTVICTDKTGTLTKDEMTVRALWVGGETLEVTGSGYGPEGEFRAAGAAIMPGNSVRDLLTAAALCNDARLVHSPEGWHIHGDPTEGALVVAAAKAGLRKDALDEQYERVGEIPFASETKRMTTVHASQRATVACTKGAAEVVLAGCTRLRTAEGTRPLTDEDRSMIVSATHAMAEAALRVLGVARKEGASISDAESDMTFLGLVGMMDPPRPEAARAVAHCRDAGIKVVMITGDHPVTAKAIATELGILRGGRVVTGGELEHLDASALAADVEGIDVYARVSPSHKLAIVEAFQSRDSVVAMTGDGVNDAPALKRADIGIAMGITGTDVTKEAAALMLSDDNFASIVAAVEEGRIIFGNIKKYLMYLLSSNIGEIGLMAGAVLLGLPVPLSAVQILYVNLATDGLPALALAVDPPQPGLMKRPPRDPRSGIFTRPVVELMVIGGVWSMIVNLGLFAWALRSGRGLETAMTMTFVSLVLIQFFKAYNFRSDLGSALLRPFANRWLNVAVVWELALLGLIVTVPFLETTFGLALLSVRDWLLVAVLAASVTPVLEIAKWRLRWYNKHR